MGSTIVGNQVVRMPAGRKLNGIPVTPSVGMVPAGVSPDRIADLIRTERLQIINDDGEVVGELAGTTGFPSITFFHDDPVNVVDSYIAWTRDVTDPVQMFFGGAQPTAGGHDSPYIVFVTNKDGTLTEARVVVAGESDGSYAHFRLQRVNGSTLTATVEAHNASGTTSNVKVQPRQVDILAVDNFNLIAGDIAMSVPSQAVITSDDGTDESYLQITPSSVNLISDGGVGFVSDAGLFHNSRGILCPIARYYDSGGTVNPLTGSQSTLTGTQITVDLNDGDVLDVRGMFDVTHGGGSGNMVFSGKCFGGVGAAYLSGDDAQWVRNSTNDERMRIWGHWIYTHSGGAGTFTFNLSASRNAGTSTTSSVDGSSIHATHYSYL